MSTEKKVRTQIQSDAIVKGALNLPLAERVHLRDQLEDSIKAEVELKKEEYRKASEIANIPS